MSSKPKIVAVVGPTASGKTALSIELAKEFAGEVISADSRQVYKGMDIGTSKVTPEEMDGVPHHLLDVVEPSEIFTGAEFVRLASNAIEDITNRGNLPIIAGGTFFYVDLLRGKMQAAPVAPDSDFRTTLEQYTNQELFELLQSKDSRRANTIEQHNRRRLVRALEVIHTLGAVPEQTETESPYECLVLGIDIEKEVLLKKFEQRITHWLANGFQAEVEQLQSEGISDARFQEFGFEYTLMLEYMRGEITEPELTEKFVQKNWQYAKRQKTWLKRDKEVVWLRPEDTDDASALVKKFLAG